MTFAILLGKTQHASDKQPPGWKSAVCAPVGETKSHSHGIRCESETPVAQTTGMSFGVRSNNYRVSLDLRVLDESGAVLATYRADRQGFLTRITLGFDAPLNSSAVIIEGLDPEQQLEHASMHALAEEDPALVWRDARLVGGRPGDKSFVYATDAPVKFIRHEFLASTYRETPSNCTSANVRSRHVLPLRD